MLNQIKLFPLVLNMMGSLALTRAGPLLNVRDSATFSIEVFGPVGKGARFINSGDWKATSGMMDESNFSLDNELMRDVDYERIGFVDFKDLTAGTETQVLSVLFEEKGIALIAQCTAKLNQNVEESKIVKFYVTEETTVIGDENKDLVTFDCGYEKIEQENTTPQFSLKVWTPEGKGGGLAETAVWGDATAFFGQEYFEELDKTRDGTKFQKIGDIKFNAGDEIYTTIKAFTVRLWGDDIDKGVTCWATLIKPVEDIKTVDFYIKGLGDVGGEYDKDVEPFISFKCDISTKNADY